MYNPIKYIAGKIQNYFKKDSIDYKIENPTNTGVNVVSRRNGKPFMITHISQMPEWLIKETKS